VSDHTHIFDIHISDTSPKLFYIPVITKSNNLLNSFLHCDQTAVITALKECLLQLHQIDFANLYKHASWEYVHLRMR